MKAVIPAAGLGTRFLPLTKDAPKEMLPLIDKPAIQYVVEEAAESGCDDILIVTGRGKTSIEDHFDKAPELERILEERGDDDLLKQIQAVADLADIHYIRQKEPLGLGHAVLQARKHVGDEPFAVLLGDDIVFNRGDPCTRQLIDVYEETGSSVIAVEPITPDQTESYGVVDVPEDDPEPALQEIRGLVEKPSPDQAPSHLGILGRYVLTPEVFDAIEETPPGVGDEVQLTDALELLGRDQDLYSYAFEGKRYDLGNKTDWLKTNVEVALMHKQFRDELRPFLEALLENGPPALVG